MVKLGMVFQGCIKESKLELNNTNKRTKRDMKENNNFYWIVTNPVQNPFSLYKSSSSK